MGIDFFFNDGEEQFVLNFEELTPYFVTCARCGASGSSMDFIPEEGDEWECPECWERCNAAEKKLCKTP